jgi:hypothetical protein
MMNRNLKMGVNSHARRLIGSAPGWAGSSGGWGDGEMGLPEASTPALPGTQAATTIALIAIRRSGPIQDRRGRKVTRCGPR